MQKVNLLLTDEANKIYKGLPNRNKGAFVSEAIIEKHNRANGEIFTEEQMKVIDLERMHIKALDKEITKLREQIEALEQMLKESDK